MADNSDLTVRQSLRDKNEDDLAMALSLAICITPATLP